MSWPDGQGIHDDDQDLSGGESKNPGEDVGGGWGQTEHCG